LRSAPCAFPLVDDRAPVVEVLLERHAALHAGCSLQGLGPLHQDTVPRCPHRVLLRTQVVQRVDDRRRVLGQALAAAPVVHAVVGALAEAEQRLARGDAARTRELIVRSSACTH
jgi:hypothetical protein